MANQSEELKKLELISTARKIVNAEYVKRRSEEYNIWLLTNKDAFKNQNIALPFPPLGGAYIPFQSSVKFPTEEEVVKKAVELYRLNVPVPSPVPAPIPEPMAASTETQTVETTTIPIVPEEVTRVPVHNVPVQTVQENAIEASVVSDELTDIQLRDALVAEIYKIYEDVSKPESIVEPKLSDTTSSKPEVYDVVQTTTEKIIDAEPVNTIAPAPLPDMGSTKSGIMPSVLQRIQEMKDRWSNKGEQNV
jgi:hypothetical protein